VPLLDQPDHEGSAYQVRGMATTAEARSQGIGSALLTACIAEARRMGANWIWCNARTPASGFYGRHGFKTQGGVFDIPTAGPHIRMLRAV
jgi:GNAT superfamily N-acetyltransferase